MISASDILFIKPYRIDDTDLTGGISTETEITDDELTNLFRDVSGEYIYWGGERFRKLFIKNDNTSSGTFYSVGVYVFVDSQSDDYFSVVTGTDIDYGKDAENYTGWHITGTLNTAIIGRDSKAEGPVTSSFDVLCKTGVSGSGFYSNSRVIINQANRYEIAKIGTVSWPSINIARLTTTHELVDSFSVGAIVSSIYEMGDIEADASVPVWFKQVIPVDSDHKRLCRVKIGILGA